MRFKFLLFLDLLYVFLIHNLLIVFVIENGMY